MDEISNFYKKYNNENNKYGNTLCMLYCMEIIISGLLILGESESKSTRPNTFCTRVKVKVS